MINIEASQRVKKLTGHDNVFKIHFIGELKIRNIKPRIRNVQIVAIIDSHMLGINVIFIPIVVSEIPFIQLKRYNNVHETITFTIKLLMIFIAYDNV